MFRKVVFPSLCYLQHELDEDLIRIAVVSASFLIEIFISYSGFIVIFLYNIQGLSNYL